MVSAIVREIELTKNYLPDTNISTIYFGGGTPSILSIAELDQIMEALQRNYTWNSAEITLECNPDDLTDNKLKELRSLGINRLSIGLQSFNDDELRWMNRAHTAEESLRSVKLAQDNGFSNITIDLIYGSKFQTLDSWDKTLRTAVGLDVQHISAYNLTIETKTRLGVQNKKGLEPAINDDISAAQFRYMIDYLASEDFEHYEISNFAKPGYISKHNSNYWLGVSYLGLGPSAHSYNGVNRKWNISNNTIYIKKTLENESCSEMETLTMNERYNEYILTRLRTKWGCSFKDIGGLFGQATLHHFERMIERFEDKLLINGDIVTLNLQGKLMADHIASEMFL